MKSTLTVSRVTSESNWMSFDCSQLVCDILFMNTLGSYVMFTGVAPRKLQNDSRHTSTMNFIVSTNDYNKLWRKQAIRVCRKMNRYICNIIEESEKQESAHNKYDCGQLPFIMHAASKGMNHLLTSIFYQLGERKRGEILSRY